LTAESAAELDQEAVEEFGTEAASGRRWIGMVQGQDEDQQQSLLGIGRGEMQEASGAALLRLAVQGGAIDFTGEGLVDEGFGGRAKCAANGSEIVGILGGVLALAIEERCGVETEPFAQGAVGEDDAALAIERVNGQGGTVQQARDKSAGSGRTRHGKRSLE
jgi:hypothetical protein